MRQVNHPKSYPRATRTAATDSNANPFSRNKKEAAHSIACCLTVRYLPIAPYSCGNATLQEGYGDNRSVYRRFPQWLGFQSPSMANPMRSTERPNLTTAGGSIICAAQYTGTRFCCSQACKISRATGSSSKWLTTSSCNTHEAVDYDCLPVIPQQLQLRWLLQVFDVYTARASYVSVECGMQESSIVLLGAGGGKEARGQI
jgi:hypothetical protein